jgi:inhibitor of KinA
MIKNIFEYGDQAILIDFGDEIKKEINQNVIFIFKTLKKIIKENQIKGIENLTPSYNKLVIQFNLNITDSKEVIKLVENLKNEKLETKFNPKKIEIPISYDLEYGIDLQRLSKITNLDIEAIVSMHLNTKFYVYMLGFLPGFPYMGDLSPQLYSKRLETPRVEIKEGSVIIVEQFCAIYPYKSPGGWNIIGRTPLKLFDQKLKQPSLINPGDEVSFKNISKEEFLKIYKKNYES